MLALGGCFALGHGNARADEGRSRLDLDLVFDAPPECPSREEVEAQLRARVPERWLSGADTRRFAIRIERESDGGYSGQLDVRVFGREPSLREIRAPACRAVSTSLVVILAIALDPDAEVEPDHGRETVVDRPVPPPVSSSSDGRGATTLRSPPVPPPTASWTWSSGGRASHLRMPAPAWGGRVFAEVTRSAPHASLAPSARLSWGWSDFSLQPERAGEALFRLRTARVEGCARVTLTSSVVVSPCAALEIGTLAVTTPELPRAGQAKTRWTAGAAIVRAGWSLLPWLAIEVETGLLVPFERTRFGLVDPARFVYRAPNVLFEGGLGVSLSARIE
ncbi:MAG: hypothetical protein BGO98_30505 [Myxococcales bacterium 68-20]|nr:MAG: hypothetical protein BGO98_30505 [Myxococcales bacterium 68-20]